MNAEPNSLWVREGLAFEKQLILTHLRENRGHLGKTAQKLGISQGIIQRKIKEFEIDFYVIRKECGCRVRRGRRPSVIPRSPKPKMIRGRARIDRMMLLAERTQRARFTL